jgi:methyl-accepting chemotaxis protein
MTIRTTIISFSAANAILLIAVMAGFILFSNYQGEKLERLVSRDLAFSRAVDQTYSIGLRAGIALRNLVINPRDEVASATFETARKEFSDKAFEARRVNSGKAGALMGEAAELWAKSEPLKANIVDMIQGGQNDQLMAVVGQDTDIWREIKQVIDRARIEQDRELAVSIQQNRDAILKGRLAIGLLLLIGIAGMICTVIVAFRRILHPLDRLVVAVTTVGSGDLSHIIQVNSRDELGTLALEFNAMVNNLSAMVIKLTHTSRELQSASEQISSTTRAVVSSSEIQVSGVDETFKAVMEITSLIQDVAQNVESLAVSASDSSTSTLEMAANIKEVALDVEGLDSSVEEVSSSIIQMASSVKQINSSIQRLSDVAMSTASSIAEMDSSIKEVERNALDSVSISVNLLGDAAVGKKSVEATIKGINEIRHASEQTSQAITLLDAKAGDIGKILQVIEEVAEQTNLLALNASIIAAQAGIHGRGFAVVANEIQELANRTTLSTNEISQVIKAVQNETHRAAGTIEMAEKRISNGERLSKESEEALQKIVVGIQMSTERMNQIAVATSEQSKGSNMIRQAMEHVADMVEQIVRATSEQGRGNELILESAEKIKMLTREVSLATREQANVSNFIAKTAEQNTGMIRIIKTATVEQSQNSTQIIQSMCTIQDSAQSNAASTKVLDEVILKLSRQVDLLQEEMGKFRL